MNLLRLAVVYSFSREAIEISSLMVFKTFLGTRY